MDGGLHLEGVDHAGEDDIHLVQLFPAEQLQHGLRHVPGPAHVGVLGSVEELDINGNAVLHEVGASHLAHHKQAGVGRLAQLLLRQLENVVVVGTGQALVSGDDNVADLPLLRRNVGPLIKEDMVDLRGVVENVRDGGADFLKVGLHIGQLLAGFLKIRGRDEEHGIGDLQSLLHAFDVGTDFLYACHVALTRFLASSSTPRMVSMAGPLRFPVD